jgi:phosphatidylinositol alpha-1,6-mannosyltransferase
VKILVLAHIFPPRKGGSGQWLWELYRRLSDFDIRVVAGSTQGDASFDRSSELPTSRIPLDFPSWGVWDIRGAPHYAAAFRRLKHIAAKVRPDVVHCGKSLPEGLLASWIHRWLGIPFVVYTHGEELTLAAASHELRRLTRRVLNRATAVVANSRHTCRILVDTWGVPTAKIAVMHPGVDTTRFVPATPSDVVRQRLGWLDRRVILTVGALQKRKGQDTMIRALPQIRVRCPEVLYSIAGDGWERRYLEELVQACGVTDAVQFRGISDEDELVRCYQQCDVFALPNRQVGWDFEGFGIVLLEAQACGKPVIAGRSGGTAETLDPSQTGELIACENPDILARTAADLLDDAERRRVLGERAREWVVDHFAWDTLSRRAAETFQRIERAGRIAE